MACDSPLDQRIKGNMLADLFTLIGVVPLEKRKIVDVTNASKHGMYYGVYGENGAMQTSTTNQAMSMVAKQKTLKANAGGANKDFGKTFFQAGSKTKNLESAIRTSSKELPQNSSKVIGQTVTKVEKAIIKETDGEYKRRGKFVRVFPNLEYNYYK